MRDRSALGWNFIFPFLIIVGFSLIFGSKRVAIYKVGLLGNGKNLSQIREGVPPTGRLREFLGNSSLDILIFQNHQRAVDRLNHHKIDFLLDLRTDPPRYWISESSPKGLIVEQIFRGAGVSLDGILKEAVSGREIRYLDWLFPGVLAMNLMFSALFGVGYVVVRYRKLGVLKRLQATPLNAVEYISAQVFSRMVLIIFFTVVVFVGCQLIYGFECRGSYLDLLLLFLLGGMSQISIGLLIAARVTSEELAGGLLNLISWPMMFLSEVWFSLEGAPEWIRKVSLAFPLTHLTDGARQIMNDGVPLSDLSAHMIVLGVMTVCFIALGSLGFKWGTA